MYFEPKNKSKHSRGLALSNEKLVAYFPDDLEMSTWHQVIVLTNSDVNCYFSEPPENRRPNRDLYGWPVFTILNSAAQLFMIAWISWHVTESKFDIVPENQERIGKSRIFYRKCDVRYFIRLQLSRSRSFYDTNNS